MPASKYSICVRLRPGQLAWLAAVKVKILATQGIHIDRSSVLRACVDSLAASRVDLSKCAGEAAIREAITRRLGAGSAAVAARRRNRREVAAL